MDITTIYAVAAGALLAFFVLVELISSFFRLMKSRMLQFIHTCARFICKELTYPYFIGRHHLLGPWTRASVMLHILYIGINLFALTFHVRSVADAGYRAGRLSLINMVVLFAGAPLSTLADLLGISLRSCRRIHRACSWMAGSLLIIHTMVKMASEHRSFPLQHIDNLLAIIGAGVFGAILIASLPYIRREVYEIFLIAHQGLALFLLCAIWYHLPSSTLRSPRLLILIMAGVRFTTFLLQVLRMMYQNGLLPSRRSPRILVSHAPTGGKINSSEIMVRVVLSRPLKVLPGQYIYLWIPSVTLFSWAQSHPFMVTSWSPKEQDTLELFVKPRRGLSQSLAYHAAEAGWGHSSLSGFISGPYGPSEPVHRYKNILIVATDVGIAAALPYLRMLINSSKAWPARTHRLHFVWQLDTLDSAGAAEYMLNDLLKNDGEHYVLAISLYVESKDTAEELGHHKRALVGHGKPDYREIIRLETSGNQLTGIDSASDDPGESLVMVSASGEVRDEIRSIVRDYLDHHVRMLELEFQP
ncbi:putative metalloreductase transmembrane component [Aspergillus sclerotiicarbonarius CBS 121057]|uniref:Putative metalloreductase transmembrane component n=1 Tax=Aspergillus sclerotiicarbonarius (strain CBS 121057 / IBT 28362) TaxID=1448318 RepID=A0A319ECK8_ASPSB|nr:putative metalloreductase transmembrane component [Aspergillus sclerotiicarbonarius CBS 121057]